MSIDLSSIIEIRDKIGIITKITDASGRVLWSAAKPVAKVTLTADTFENENYAGAFISYVNPNGDYVSIDTAGEYEIPIGTIIRFELKSFSIDRLNLAIHLNGEQILLHFNEVYYEYTLTGDIVIKPVNNYDIGGEIYITEIPEGHALLSIDYSNPERFSTSVDGVSYNDTTITVPIGSVVEISAFNLSCYKGCSDGSASVYINDNLVASESKGIDYSYTVRGNTAITSYVNPSYCRDCDNYAYDAIINITEQ